MRQNQFDPIRPWRSATFGETLAKLPIRVKLRKKGNKKPPGGASGGYGCVVVGCGEALKPRPTLIVGFSLIFAQPPGVRVPSRRDVQAYNFRCLPTRFRIAVAKTSRNRLDGMTPCLKSRHQRIRRRAQIVVLAAQEDIDGGIIMLGPAMDADVRFREQGDRGNPLAFAEAVQPEIEQRRPRARHSGPKRPLHTRGIVKTAAFEQVEEEVGSGEAHGQT